MKPFIVTVDEWSAPLVDRYNERQYTIVHWRSFPISALFGRSLIQIDNLNRISILSSEKTNRLNTAIWKMFFNPLRFDLK